jgi:hypothetical protein
MARRKKHADRIQASQGGSKTFPPIKSFGGSACKITAEVAIDGKPTPLPRFAGKAYTGDRMRPEGWWQDVVIDLTGVETPKEHRPALRQHDHMMPVGHTDRWHVHPTEGIDVEGVFSGQDQHRNTVIEPAGNGFPWQLSVGADPLETTEIKAGETATINGRDFTGPLVISRKTRLKEISFVPLGADDATFVKVAASSTGRFAMEVKELLKAAMKTLRVKAGSPCHYSDGDIDNMDEAKAKAALKDCMKYADDTAKEEKDAEEKEKKDKAESAARTSLNGAGVGGSVFNKDAYLKELRAAQAEENLRVGAIRAACNQHGVGKTTVKVNGSELVVNSLADHAIAAGWTVDQVNAQILEAIRTHRPSEGFVAGGLGYSTSNPLSHLNERTMEWAILEATSAGSPNSIRKLDDDDTYSTSIGNGNRIRRLPFELEHRTKTDLKAMYSDNTRQQGYDISRRGRLTLKETLNMLGVASGLRPNKFAGESDFRDFLKGWEYQENLTNFGARPGIQADGTSNMSLPNVLANVLNKYALVGYLNVEQAWRRLSSVRNVPDFKPVKPINLLGYVMYQQLSQSGELPSGSLYDQAFSNQALPYGLIMTIPWTIIVNDDIGMLQMVPLLIGRGAGLALNNEFFAVFMNPGTADDGNSFYNNSTGTHGTPPAYQATAGANYISGGTSAFSPGALQLLKTLRDQQFDPTGYPLGIAESKPILAFPSPLWQTVKSLYISEKYTGISSGASTPADNPWRGEFEPVQSVYLDNSNYVNYSATAFYMLYDPALMPSFETVFLNGDTPQVLTAGPDFQFNRLGISIRGTMAFGCNQQNFRGAYKSAGA